MKDELRYSIIPLDVLRVQQDRLIKALFKDFLEMVEDIKARHDVSMDKMIATLPQEYKKNIDLADHFTEEECCILRKRILDKGNNTLREMNEILKQFNISLK